MLNEKRIAEILEECRCDGKIHAYFLALKLDKKLRLLKKRIKNNRINVGDNHAVRPSEWLRENFPKIDENIRGKRCVLRGMRGLEKSDGQVRLFKVFSAYLLVENSCDAEHIKELFSFVNVYGKGLGLADGKSLVTLFECAVCDRIMDEFLKAFDSTSNSEELVGNIEKLFFTLDEMSGVCEDDALLSNVTENILMKDPYGIYTKLSSETKKSYRENLIRLSKKRGETTAEFAEKIVRQCEKNQNEKRHIGTYLCDRADGGKTYLVLVCFLTLLFTILLCLVSPVFLLSLFSVYCCTRLFLDKIFNRFFVKGFHLPRIELEKIPHGNGVMVVVTTLLTGGEGDKAVLENLEKMYFSNGGENIYFGLLADLVDNRTETCENDDKIIRFANEKIMELRRKYGEVFFLFIRNREYSETEMCYIAPERKRGAVGALTSFLCSKSDGFSDGSIKPSEDVCENIRFVFTLDSDTNLAFDCVKTMTGIMLHPVNNPVVDENRGVVKKGYGILQPSMSTTVSSAMSTYFSKVMCGHGGVDVYSAGGSDYYMSLFGRSIFCGKGMFDKNCFYKTLCAKNDFRKESVLSHDAPEGARLRCAYVPDITLTDSFPKEELSYYKRGHRWIRGDVQNLIFVKPYVENARGEKQKNNIDVFSKFFMLDNVLNALVPVFSLVMLFVSLFCEKNIGLLVVTVTFAVYILPFVNSVVTTAKRTIWHNVKRMFYSSGIYTGIWTSFMRMLFRICALPKSAEVSFDALVRSIYRMTVSGKKKLEWMTAAQSDEEKRDGLLGYVKKNLFCAVCGCIFFVMSDVGFLRFVALMWLFLPLFAYRTGIKYENKTVVTKHEKNTLLNYAEDMWRFFEESTNQRTNHLPPDNVSIYPERKMSRMTSPTNIGLYLLSVLCARKFGFIDSVPMCERIEKCVSSIENLPKYKGLLYNWYDVFCAKSMTPEYISSVDIGNYIVCLECVAGALQEFEDEIPDSKNLVDRIKKLVDETDVSVLFDKRRKLFYIGGAVKDGALVLDKNRYDMLMSEARSLSLAALAKRIVPISHLSRLSRRFVEGDGFLGLASWSGTAFEFFMPELFVKSKEGSLVYEALRFSYSQQKKSGINTKYGRIFGISESCYNELDSDMNYKYKAFGVSKTAVNVFDEQRVVSPYSSFLFMPMSVKENLENLERLEKLGAYGEYGFFESVDFERKRKNAKFSVVECFMSHHIGMSICAAANAVFDDVIHDWYMKDVKNSVVTLLSEEKIPYNAYVRKISRRNYAELYTQTREDKKHPLNECRTARLCGENVDIYSKRNRLKITCYGLAVTKSGVFDNSLGSFDICIDIDGECFLFGRMCTLYGTDGRIVYSRRIKLHGGDIFDASLALTIGKNTSDVVRMRLKIKQLSGEKNKHPVCRFSFSPLMEYAENHGKCTFFEENARFLCVRESGVFRFENSNTKVYLYTKIHVGKNIVCEMKDDVVTMQAEPINDAGVYDCQFAMALSKSDRCAEMGIVRLKEDSFEDMVAELEKARNLSESKKRTRGSNVLGAVTEKKKINLVFPINSREEPFVLLSSGRLSTLVLGDNLGFSFGDDVNKNRITKFESPDRISSETLVFDGNFDLCINARSMEFSQGIAIYEGIFKGYFYRVEAFIPKDMPMKVIRVSTDSILPPDFSVVPHSEPGLKCEIAGGMVFFGKDDKNCFLCGYFQNEGLGARYVVDDRIKAEFDRRNQDGLYEYVFAVGITSDREEAYNCERLIRENFDELRKSAQKLKEELTFDASIMRGDIRNALEGVFVFPVNDVVYRSLINTADTLKGFDLLLLCYAGDKKLEEKFSAFLSDETEKSSLSKLMCPIILSEYVRISGDMLYPDKRIGQDSIYRKTLMFLSESTEELRGEKKLIRLCKTAFLCMADLCDRMGDIRTAVALRDKAKKDTETKGGIFM